MSNKKLDGKTQRFSEVKSPSPASQKVLKECVRNCNWNANHSLEPISILMESNKNSLGTK